MKMTKTLSLDEEIVRKLMQEPNQSELANTLFTNYFKKKAFDGLNKEELKKELEIIKLKKRINKLQNGE